MRDEARGDVGAQRGGARIGSSGGFGDTELP